MGYEHFWALQPDMDLARWRQLCADVHRLFAAMPSHVPANAEHHASEPITLCSDLFDDKANINDEYITFNGGNGLGLETFFLQRTGQDGSGGWVKTGLRPYDLAVCVTLLALLHHFPEANVGSCGSAHEWKQALELFESVVGPAPLKRLLLNPAGRDVWRSATD